MLNNDDVVLTTIELSRDKKTLKELIIKIYVLKVVHLTF